MQQMTCKLAMQICNFARYFPIAKAVVLKYIMHCDVTSMIFAYYSKQNISMKKQNKELL